MADGEPVMENGHRVRQLELRYIELLEKRIATLEGLTGRPESVSKDSRILLEHNTLTPALK